jgi:enamine deaminase RidA (YjgF/YER057c/UK114 family)
MEEMGIELPSVSPPLAEYVPARRASDLVFTSGQVPAKGGEFIHVGKLGANLTVEQGQDCARLCVLNALAAVKGLVGSLDRIEEVVQVRGFVNSAPDFGDQPEVINGASELLVRLFGESGRHARSAVGAILPRNVPVELELVVRVGR